METIDENRMIRVLKEQYKHEKLQKAGAKWPSDIKRALEYLNRHLFEFGCTVSKMRATCHINQNNYSMKFRYLIGMTPLEYIRLHRIHCSQRMMKLSNGRCSITLIGFEVGYEQPSTFCEAFKKVAGMSPRAYKNKLKGTLNNQLKNEAVNGW